MLRGLGLEDLTFGEPLVDILFTPGNDVFGNAPAVGETTVSLRETPIFLATSAARSILMVPSLFRVS
jgi:hypothetical protein